MPMTTQPYQATEERKHLITIETRHNLEIQFHIAYDQWKYLTKQTPPWCAVSSGINSHLEILPLSMRLQIEGENQSSSHPYF